MPLPAAQLSLMLVNACVHHLFEKIPALLHLQSSLLVAINGEYASFSSPLKEVDFETQLQISFLNQTCLDLLDAERKAFWNINTTDDLVAIRSVINIY